MSRAGLVVETPRGRVELTGAAAASLVARAAETVPGVVVRRPRRGLDVVLAGDPAVAVSVSVPIGTVLGDAAGKVQDRIAEALAAATGIEARVDVLVEEVRA